MSDKVVIQLNLPALERLLGGDSAMEIELRHQVAEEFAKKHLKAILNDECYKRMRHSLTVDLHNLVHEKVEELKKSPSPDLGWAFDLNNLIQKRCEETLAKILEKYTQSQQWYLPRLLDDAVKKAMPDKIEAVIEAEIKRRLTIARETK
jgi:hypothetical protein